MLDKHVEVVACAGHGNQVAVSRAGGVCQALQVIVLAHVLHPVAHAVGGQLVEAGVSVFKLEGRGRSEAYVSTVTSVYKEAVQCCARGEWNPEKVGAWEGELLRVFNRQFWHGGYYLGEEWETWSGCSNSLALEQRQHLGRVMRWYAKVGVAEIRLEAGPVAPGDNIEITGVTTGIVRVAVPEVRCDDEQGVTQVVPVAPKGATALIPVDTKVRHGDKVYIVTRRKLK